MNRYEIRIIVDNEFNSLHHYKEVFDFFTRFDTIYSHFIKDSIMLLEPNKVKGKNSRIVSISNRSVELTVFVEKPWIELLIIFLASSRNYKNYAIDTFQDYTHSINHFGPVLKYMISDFPDFDEELISPFLKWFNSVSIEKQYYLIQYIKKGSIVSRRIRKISIKKVIPAGKNQDYTIILTPKLNAQFKPK